MTLKDYIKEFQVVLYYIIGFRTIIKELSEKKNSPKTFSELNWNGMLFHVLGSRGGAKKKGKKNSLHINTFQTIWKLKKQGLKTSSCE